MIYLVVHGIRSTGEQSIDRLGSALMLRHGAQVVDVDLPVRNTFSARWTLSGDAKRLATSVVHARSSVGAKPHAPVTLLCHSHGCGVGLAAARMTPVHAIWMFNPAVSHGYDVSRLLVPADRIWCVYSKQDWIVRLGALIPFDHPFGNAGARGLSTIPRENNLEADGGHSACFKWPQVGQWADEVHRRTGGGGA